MPPEYQLETQNSFRMMRRNIRPYNCPYKLVDPICSKGHTEQSNLTQ